MGLSQALVDRARVIRSQTAGFKVEGRTVYDNVPSEWFMCRLTVREGVESLSDGRQRVSKPSEILFGVRDLAGGEVVLHADDRLEVDSADFGRQQWRVTTEPEVLRRRAAGSKLGWIAHIARVEEPGP